ncbi:hypothetical protein B9Z55_007707 [Caenorhabditis nigoni]|nr:hypothetical protein B9Z55_007707 [Caenorhabditis nigoni]
MRIRPEPESTIPLENNQVTEETGEIAGAGDTSNAALLVEIKKLRSELIATTEENRKKQDEMLQKFESKMEDMKKGVSEKLQSIEALTSNDKPEKSDSTRNVASSKPVKQFKLKHVFEDSNKFQENVSNFSLDEDHDKVNWYINLMRRNNHLGFYVGCEPIAPADDKWSIRTITEYKVVGRKKNDVMRTCENCYQTDEGWGFSKFLDWEEMNKYCLADGKLQVEAKVTIIETTGLGKRKIRKFDESQEDVSDVILVVRDTKFYVSKMYLAAQSPIFKTLLLGNFSESKQSEVKLNGIDPDDFHYFLELLYGESAVDGNVMRAFFQGRSGTTGPKVPTF